jgi:hypothetical protein
VQFLLPNLVVERVAERTWDDLKGIFLKSISLEQLCAVKQQQMNMFLLMVGGLYT